MKYLLDTNICIYFFRGKYDLAKKINSVGTENCFISEITLAELVYGAEYSDNPKKKHALISKFIDQVSIIPVFDAILEYGKQKARLRKDGKLIGDFDLLIGATSIANNLTIVTENVQEFKRLKGIKIENWIKR